MEWSKGTYRYSRLRWGQKESANQVLHEIAAFLRSEGLKVSERNFSVSRLGNKFPQSELGITNAEDTRVAIRAMLPYFIVKKERAIEALAILDEVHDLKLRYGNKYRVHMAKEAA